ncbi:aldehyde dehydrogenase (NADP(+)) [Novosphingobium resinovorum]|uniref:aldehyde dehydrogenase (NADP(+)) n=1 Tax=Novosphingobium resinovorum TaxID=158500 RepID=UPI002ED18951|nr:aldehyde dehydrogenase (NADP(+)) [Novosphingobium resinovorum]
MITGAILIGREETHTDAGYAAVAAATGEALEPRFTTAGLPEVERACALADDAAIPFAELEPETRAVFLETIADEIVAIGDILIERAMAETGLPRARLEGERGRTTGQLRLFAQVLREGSWAGLTIDPALPERAPLPRPDLRMRKVALGPVVVFGASNFPLAFSVAGGDTASAFAAGCPVIVKGHSAHPGTGELVARAIQRAVALCHLPEGVFSYLPATREAGTALVADHRVKAVGFTGSRPGGMALMRTAAARPEPIPVYAEMSSINPVVLFPAALAARAEALGAAFVGSLTMGAGQFCTNPGLVIAIDGPDLDTFLASASAAMGGSAAQDMLTPGIHSAYVEGVSALAGHGAVTTLARGVEPTGPYQAQGALFRTTAADFLADPALGAEVFGSSSLVITVTDMAEALKVIAALEGQLTATLILDAEDEPEVAKLLPVLERKVGRILVNGWPTGVEVCHAMVHGGPFPSTSDGRTTSVGASAIERFLRPVCYQNMPSALLPEGLRDGNPWNAPRRIDGILKLA